MDLRNQRHRAIARKLIGNLGSVRAEHYCRLHHWVGVLKAIQALAPEHDTSAPRALTER